MAIAADSFVEPGRALTVLRTALIHLQNRLACDSRIPMSFLDILFLEKRMQKNLIALRVWRLTV